MISIYTHTYNPFKIEFWKFVAKKAIMKYSGPDAVLDSLKRGLLELNIPFEVNPIKPKYDIVHVLSGIAILREMIDKKQCGEIKTLIAGPTLVQTPYDFDNIIQNKNIDIIVFPSQWTKDFYTSLTPQLEKKIKIWAAGVKIPETISTKKKILVYVKNIQKECAEEILKIVKNSGIPYDIIKYGKYNKRIYHEKLLSTSMLIYLQKTESQGLALQEAWSYDVPTLVLQNTLWNNGKYTWSDEKISAPYLTEETGIFFTKNNLCNILDKIMNKEYKFNPRNYCINNLSDKITTQKYLEIIKDHAK